MVSPYHMVKMSDSLSNTCCIFCKVAHIQTHAAPGDQRGAA
jgi:hypothetical protein